MKKYRTVACVIIMAIAAIAGFFIGGATLDEPMGGAILFSMIAGKKQGRLGWRGLSVLGCNTWLIPRFLWLNCS